MGEMGDDQSRARNTRARRPPPKGLAEAVRTARTRVGMSQRDLATATDLSQSMVSRIESGQRGVGIPTLRRLASELRWSDELLEQLRRRVKDARPRRRKMRRAGWRLAHLPELVGRKAMARIDRASGRRGKGGRPMRRQRFTRR